MAQYTPMIQQYLSIKAEATDALMFFRLGDFYELFFEDAITASRELEITLTGREGGGEEKIPMCGVPYHAADNYIARLIDKGYKVAICEQVEEASASKGMVRREIVRFITPGTVMEGRSLGEGSNNFIVCVSSQGNAYGLCACDLSTGEFYVTQMMASLPQLLDELHVYSPAEMIGDIELLDVLKSQVVFGLKPILFTPWEQVEEVKLKEHFTEKAISKLTAIQYRTMGLMLHYLYQTQKRSISHITSFEAYASGQYMTLDPFTRRNLELVETVRERSKKGSLFWLLDRTVTSMGTRLLRRWMDQPLLSKAAIEDRLEAVDVLFHQYILREDLREQLKEIYDLERLVGRIAFGNANARDLLALQSSLERVPALMDLCSDSGSQTLSKVAKDVDLCTDILSWINIAISLEPPVSVREGGMIKEGYHEYLDQLREASVNGKQWIAQLERQERERTGIKSLKIGYNRVFGYYIEVTKANAGSLEEGRYERKQTLANAERYITPELKEKETLILEAEEKMVDIEFELFTELRNRIAAQTARLQQLAERIALIDVFQSLGSVSAAHHYRKPEITDQYDLIIEEGRHPIIEALSADSQFIANATTLTKEESRILLITGPNMAGKSTYMRQVALICIMAQMGCFVPASKARIPLTDRIFTRIGAADDLISGQSTFMVEMMDIQVMTEKATSHSLVIIDELGRGTSTGEGMAIAQAVIEHLHDHTGCKTLVSTHFHELAHLEMSLQYLRNYCMAVQESGDQVTFLRKLVEGAASTSYGIYCARLAGLPDPIIDRSYALLQGFESKQMMVQSVSQVAATSQPEQLIDLEISTSNPDPASVIQLSLFGEREDKKSLVRDDKAKYKLTAEKEQLIERIRTLDVLNMTPIQAIQIINELQRSLHNI